MKKLSLIISMFLLVCMLFTGCENIATSSIPTTNNTTSNEVTTSDIITSTTSSNSSKKESSKSSSSNWLAVTSKVATTKVKNWSAKELMEQIEALLCVDFPDSTTFVSGEIEYVFEQKSKLSEQHAYIEYLTGEMDAVDAEKFILEYDGRKITAEDFADEKYSPVFVWEQLEELVKTEKNALGFYEMHSIQNIWKITHTGYLGTVFYEKNDGKYAVVICGQTNNPNRLIGTVQVQSNGSAKPNKTQSSSSAPISSKNSSSAPISSQNSSVVTGSYSVSDILSDYLEAGKNKTYTIEDFYWVIPGKTTVRQLLDKCPPKDFMIKSGLWPGHTLLYYTDYGEIIEVVVDGSIFYPDKSTVYLIHYGSTVIK